MQPREGEIESENTTPATTKYELLLLRCCAAAVNDNDNDDAMPSIDAGSATVQFSVRTACVCVQVC